MRREVTATELDEALVALQRINKVLDNPALLTPPQVAVKAKKPKLPKEPSLKGGGWQIKAEWYGTGMTIQCKEPVDGSFWECDHDALADKVNASLKSKGKTILGEPGPSAKQYGSSGGLREPGLWRRV